MKKHLFLFIVATVIISRSSAQTINSVQPLNAKDHFDAVEFSKHLGKKGVLCDTVKSFRIVSDTLSLLNMGGVYPHQKYTIVIRGNKINVDWANIKGKAVCVSGVFEMYKDQPQIAVAEPEFFEAH